MQTLKTYLGTQVKSHEIKPNLFEPALVGSLKLRENLPLGKRRKEEKMLQVHGVKSCTKQGHKASQTALPMCPYLSRAG